MNEVSQIVLPKLGLTMTEGLVASWQVKPGDEVSAGDILVVIETDKIANEVEASGSGRIVELMVGEGQTVPVGTPIATWTGAGQTSDAGPSATVAPSGEPADSKAPASSPLVDQVPAELAGAPSRAAVDGRVLATPLARRLAASAGMPLGEVRGSGPNGRIKAQDVRGVMAAAGVADAALPLDHEVPARRPATQIEKIVARRLTEAKQTIPHFYVMDSAETSRLESLRVELNEGAALRISVNHFIVAALARAFMDIPTANALWDNDEIVTRPSVDIGIAVDTPRGLLVPVLRDAGSMTVDDVARESTPIVARARDGKLLQGELNGGVASVSNVGMFGVSGLVPIINPGQSAILGVGARQALFRPNDRGEPVLCQEIQLVLSCDHRVMNGALAARLLQSVRYHLENPLRILRK